MVCHLFLVADRFLAWSGSRERIDYSVVVCFVMPLELVKAWLVLVAGLLQIVSTEGLVVNCGIGPTAPRTQHGRRDIPSSRPHLDLSLGPDHAIQ